MALSADSTLFLRPQEGKCIIACRRGEQAVRQLHGGSIVFQSLSLLQLWQVQGTLEDRPTVPRHGGFNLIGMRSFDAVQWNLGCQTLPVAGRVHISDPSVAVATICTRGGGLIANTPSLSHFCINVLACIAAVINLKVVHLTSLLRERLDDVDDRVHGGRASLSEVS